MSETLQILEKLNSLYSGAITQLISYTIGVLAFVGIVIPALMGILQSRQLKRDHAALTTYIENQISAAEPS